MPCARPQPTRRSLGRPMSDQPPWETWDAFLDGLHEQERQHVACVAAAAAAHVPRSNADVFVPAMPTVAYSPTHRPKVQRRLPVNACVARPLSRREWLADKKARATVQAEVDRLRSCDAHRACLAGPA